MYGPKYSEPSFTTFRVWKTRGNSSFFMQIQGYDLSSFSSMLYLGWCFFIKLFSSKSASISVSTIIQLMSVILLTKFFVFKLLCVFVKYEETLLFRFFAFPTYMTSPSKS